MDVFILDPIRITFGKVRTRSRIKLIRDCLWTFVGQQIGHWGYGFECGGGRRQTLTWGGARETVAAAEEADNDGM